MIVGLDVMGGDFAPRATLQGAILASEMLPEQVQIALIGPETLIREHLALANVPVNRFLIIDAQEVIEMGENPTKAFTQKPGSSISLGFQLLKEQKIQAFCSAGNTGAMLVGAVLSVKPIEGVQRPCIMSLMPKVSGGYGILLDVGSNVDCKPETLSQFAFLGSMYAERVLGIDTPKVGLINIGEESEKGNAVAQAAFQLMKDADDYHFIGNIEGRDLFNDKADVMVCDGFTGNVILKMAESYFGLFKERELRDPFLDRFNYENYGGTPILGINATVIVGHGISSSRAIANMLVLAYEIENAGLNDKIKAVLHHE
ncbi:MAG: phosphate acyltransferase PlsX [Bacteroidia bacterium]|nr:phosphate acyltransferase PlsX [Bacteroidia bacterium]MCC6768999.1 phosphate acyltransferase PlsX [Bacteroidia bacterium]